MLTHLVIWLPGLQMAFLKKKRLLFPEIKHFLGVKTYRNLVLCKLHIVKAVNSTPPYKYGRTITSTTKDCFVSNLPDLSQFLSISNSSEQLDDATETMNSLFSSTLDTVAPLRLRKIKEKRPTPWYNEHTRTLKRAARKMERSWRKTKLEVFRTVWRESTLSYRKALKTARSDYF